LAVGYGDVPALERVGHAVYLTCPERWYKEDIAGVELGCVKLRFSNLGVALQIDLVVVNWGVTVAAGPV